MSEPVEPGADDGAAPIPSFVAVATRRRHDGWTPLRQVTFIRALADTACVVEACRRVGLSPNTAYALRRRPDAASFRQAWDVALDYAINRLADAALGRALNGVATPIFYKGEQIGERRTFNERLTMFFLRYRQPERYGAWLDDMSARERHPDGPSIRLTEAVRRVAADGAADLAGRPRPAHRPLRTTLLTDDPEEVAAAEEEAERRDMARRDEEWETYLDSLGPERDDSRHDPKPHDP